MEKKYIGLLSITLLVIIVIFGFQNYRPGEIIRRGAYSGMVYIPGGTFIMGQSDQNLSPVQIPQSRQVTISPFFMDATEVTNAQYKEFVHWVRDSILVKNILQDPAYLIQGADGEEYVNWEHLAKRSPWTSNDPAIRERVSQMFYQGEDQIYGKNEYDIRLLNYRHEWYDLRAAIMARHDSTARRSDFIRRDVIGVYPDTTVWVADFTYAQNEPMVQGYFSLPAFEDYPVVGVTWKQAEAFNHWRTKRFNDQESRKSERDRKEILPFSLPSEAEWEYAARGGKIGLPYPWGGPSPRHGGGRLLANFKPGRGDYIGGSTDAGGDGFEYTAPVKTYRPNDFGLFDMAGNVAEWTSSAYDESASSFVHDLNPTYNYDATDEDAETLKRKVVRGGSWKDVAMYLQNGARTYEYQDSAKSYIGFRSISRATGAGR